jgi:hypothetical protein
MKYERTLEIKNEAQRRLNEWLTNSSIEEMTHMGSRFKFDMSLGLMGGYPFVAKEWMNGDFKGFVTEKEFNDPDYDFIIDELFEKAISENPIDFDANLDQ